MKACLAFLMLIGSLAIVCGQLEYESEEDWLDPGDMLRYEGGVMRDRKDEKPDKEQILDIEIQAKDSRPVPSPPKTTDGQDAQSPQLPSHLDAENSQYDLQDHRSDGHGPERLAPSDSTGTKKDQTEKPLMDSMDLEFGSLIGSCTSHGKEGVFFRQFVTALLRQFPPDQDGTGVYQIIATLTEGDFAALTKFSNDMEGLEHAHEVLSRMIEDVRRTDRPRFTLLQRMERKMGFDTGSILQIVLILFLCTVSAILLLRLRIDVSFGRIVFRVFLLMFFVSVPWNWWYLYKMAVAKREAELLKDIPAECRPQDNSASKSILAWFRSSFTFAEDECAKYHERMIVDPMWEVPPTQAFAVTVTKFFLEPFKHIGVAFSGLIRGLLEDMPVQLWPIVLILFTSFTLFVIILQSNYRIRFFWNVFGLEPAQPMPQALPQPTAQPQPLPQSERDMIEEQPRPQLPLPPPPAPTIPQSQQPPTTASQTQRDEVDNERPSVVSVSHIRTHGRRSQGTSANPDNEDVLMENGANSNEDSLLPLSVPEATPHGISRSASNGATYLEGGAGEVGEGEEPSDHKEGLPNPEVGPGVSPTDLQQTSVDSLRIRHCSPGREHGAGDAVQGVTEVPAVNGDSSSEQTAQPDPENIARTGVVDVVT